MVRVQCFRLRREPSGNKKKHRFYPEFVGDEEMTLKSAVQLLIETGVAHKDRKKIFEHIMPMYRDSDVVYTKVVP